MTNKQMINELKNVLKKLSFSQLATGMGYRSQNTVILWMKNGKVPRTATDRVMNYLNSNKENPK